MNVEDQKRVNQSFEHGSANFTQEDLNKLMKDEEIARNKSKNLGDKLKDFLLILDLLKAYFNNEYTKVPWKLIAALGFAAAYVVSPIDVIPDIIPLLGFTDDIAVVGIVLATFQQELEAFRIWKESKK